MAIRVTKEMVSAFRDAMPWRLGPIQWTDKDIRDVIRAVLAVQNEVKLDHGR